MHPFAIDAAGLMYIDVASATNSCQHAKPHAALARDRSVHRTEDPRRHLALRREARQIRCFRRPERFATGIRNAEGFGIDAAGHRIFVTQHGRDQLHANWPDLYHARAGGDAAGGGIAAPHAGRRLRLAGNAITIRGKRPWCSRPSTAATAASSAASARTNSHRSRRFPRIGHRTAWCSTISRNSRRTTGNGVFIAFHGSWDRAPYPQEGYNVVFQPLAGEAAAGRCEIFADGFAGGQIPGARLHRPTGVAVGPDGALFVSDDVRGRIYRIVYRGGDSAEAGAAAIPCPSAMTPPGAVAAAAAEPPEGTHPDAGGGSAAPSAAQLPVPNGATKAQVQLGERVFHGLVGGAACTGCHGANGTGTSLGPNLTDSQWLWSDGSLDGIRSTITQGVTQPKKYRAPMPPMGGAQLTSDQLSAVAVYVWALSHRSP